MAGKGTISVNQTPQYGDKTVIQKMAQATTTTPMTGNPTPAPGAGRPPGGGGQQMPTEPELPVPTAHAELADDLARKAWAADYFQQLAMQPTAGPYTRMYAAQAMRDYQAAMTKTRSRTPYFT